jgi:hypothetical protein
MGSAKAALGSLVRYFAVALAKRSIAVNAISPWWTENSVLNSLPQQVQDLIRNWHIRGWRPMGRLGTPADVGDAVALFCSEQAGWITGQVIYADGGASLWVAHFQRKTDILDRSQSSPKFYVLCYQDEGAPALGRTLCPSRTRKQVSDSAELA